MLITTEITEIQKQYILNDLFLELLIKHNDKIGGASKLFKSSYLQHFYQVTKISKFTSVKRLHSQLTEWKRMLGMKIRSHDAFAGSEKEKQYMDKARKKLIDKGYLGKKYN